jgi:hypothetical protein
LSSPDEEISATMVPRRRWIRHHRAPWPCLAANRLKIGPKMSAMYQP